MALGCLLLVQALMLMAFFWLVGKINGGLSLRLDKVKEAKDQAIQGVHLRQVEQVEDWKAKRFFMWT